jgi:hypothetical protein
MMPTLPQVYVDFQNASPSGWVRLNCVGTTQDLSRQQVHLREGLRLMLYSGDDVDEQGRTGHHVAEGTAIYSQDESCWAAVIDWDAVRFVPDAAVAGNPVLTDSSHPLGAAPTARADN